MSLYVPLTVILACTATWYAINHRPKGRPIPGPKGLPLLGNALDLASSKGRLVPIFSKWAREHGPIAKFSIFGNNQIIISDDEIVHDLFIKRGTKYSGRGAPHAITYVSEDLITALMPYNDSWRRERKLIQSVISGVATERYIPLLTDEARRTITALKTSPKDFDQLLERFSFRVLMGVVGVDFPTEADEKEYMDDNQRQIDEVMQLFRPDAYPSNVLPFLRYMPEWLVPSVGRIEKKRQDVRSDVLELRARVDSSIARNAPAAMNGAYKNFLDNRERFTATDEEAHYTFYALLGAGFRSMHNFLLSYLYLMMKYPEWQTKLYEEVDRVVGRDRMPHYDDVSQLPTLRAIIKESIRFRTIEAELGVPHRLDEDDEYRGYYFKKGTVFHANFPHILMEKEKYPDQQKFNPARWLDSSYPTYQEPLTQYPNLQNYTPFGHGRRACPGNNITEKTMNLMIAHMAWAFEVRRPVDPTTGEEVLKDMQYEPTPNPKPMPFEAVIVSREK